MSPRYLLVASILASLSLPALGQSFFGDSVIVTAAPPACPGDGTRDSLVLAVLPFQVSAPSRLLALATLNTNVQAATVYAAVTDAQGIEVLGTSASGRQKLTRLASRFLRRGR
jgi:hypothetical protein